jgi:7,8-dihydro-6-hydroxymethylpterin-pyrophosphokinase
MKKIINKAIVEEIKKGKRKEKEDKWAKRVVDLGIITYKIIIKIAKKRESFLQVGLQQMSSLVIDFIKNFKHVWNRYVQVHGCQSWMHNLDAMRG